MVTLLLGHIGMNIAWGSSTVESFFPYQMSKKKIRICQWIYFALSNFDIIEEMTSGFLTNECNVIAIAKESVSFYLPSWVLCTKIQQTKMLVTCQRFGDLLLFGLVWQYSWFRQNIIKLDSKSWLLTCSRNITLSLPSYSRVWNKRTPLNKRSP